MKNLARIATDAIEKSPAAGAVRTVAGVAKALAPAYAAGTTCAKCRGVKAAPAPDTSRLDLAVAFAEAENPVLKAGLDLLRDAHGAVADAHARGTACAKCGGAM